MVMSDFDIKKAIAQKRLVFSPKLKPDQIGGASIDLTLDGVFWKFKKKYECSKRPVDLSKVGFQKATQKIVADSLTLKSQEMCLGLTVEKITLAPDIMGTLEGRSRFARMGLAVHITSALVQPGSSNRQVLEIVNMAPFPITIRSGMRISQVVFESLENPTGRPYAKFGHVARNQ